MTKTRAELLSVLAELSERFPEFRFGQMAVGLAWSARDFNNEAIYDVEDEDLLEAARDLLARRPNAPEENHVPAGSISPLLSAVPAGKSPASEV